jgi:hypothetical protein
MFLDMHILVDKKDVDRTLLALDQVLSGPSMSLFHRVFTEPYLRSRAKARFASNGDAAVGGTWQQLSDSRQDIRQHAGFSADPPNHTTGDLEAWITSGQNTFTVGEQFANFFMPGRGTVGQREKLRTAQQGKPAGFNMPDGAGGTKPSPSPTPKRPVVGMDSADLVHVLSAMPIWIAGEVAKRT